MRNHLRNGWVLTSNNIMDAQVNLRTLYKQDQEHLHDHVILGVPPSKPKPISRAQPKVNPVSLKSNPKAISGQFIRVGADVNSHDSGNKSKGNT